MDTRSLIALGMVLTVVVVALFKGSLDGPSVKEIIIMLGSGVIGGGIGFAVRRQEAKPLNGNGHTKDQK